MRDRNEKKEKDLRKPEQKKKKKKRNTSKKEERNYSVIAAGSFISFICTGRRDRRVNIGVIEIGHVADSNLISACN